MAYSIASTLITRTLDNLSRSSTGTTRSGATLETRAIDWMNVALRKLARYHDFGELRKLYTMTTVASSKIYSFPTAYKSIYSMRLIDGTNSYKLVNLHNRLLDRRIPNPDAESTGRSLYYAPHGDVFELFPIPDAAYQILARVADWPIKVTATTDTLTYTDEKDDILVACMTAEGFRHIQMFEDAAMWDQEYLKLAKAAKLEDADEPDWAPSGQGFDSARLSTLPGEYWNNPWVRVR